MKISTPQPNLSRGSRCVLTLATGAPIYMQMAANLARSFRWWNRHNDLRFVIVTDHPERLPADVRKWTEIVQLTDDRYGKGFQVKLHLDLLTPADQTLFIDSDCLCVGDLMPVFERFADTAVATIGNELTEGEWWGYVTHVREQFNLPTMPRFNGGVYYLERGELSTRVYTKARELEPRYDEIGLVRLRNQPNEEPLMAIAMAINGLHAAPDDGTIFGDLASYPSEWECDVLGGHTQVENPPPGHPQHFARGPVGVFHPLLIHFLGHRTGHAVYRREELTLALAVGRGWPTPLARATAWAVRYAPQRLLEGIKQVFRPVYRRLFGARSSTHTIWGDPIIR